MRRTRTASGASTSWPGCRSPESWPSSNSSPNAKEHGYALLRIDLGVGRGREPRSGLAQTHTRTAHHGNNPADLELTYTKWFAPGYPNMVGVVGGDIVGKFGGAVFERTVNGNLVHLDAIYIVIAPDPASSFTAHVGATETSPPSTQYSTAASSTAP